jgi:7-carboxy-7-deazaguanine synthase
MINNTLQVSENFFSVQAEGWTTGIPAYFIRLTGCNLSCGFSKQGIKSLNDSLTEKKRGGNDHEYADLYKEKKATWVCDSASVWLKGKATPFKDIIENWKNLNIFDWIKDQTVHIIWTGGEPTLPGHQKAIVQFLNFLTDEHNIVPFNEIETNGTTFINDDLFYKLDQINCSAKLANSGMSEEQRINPDAIERIMKHDNYWFKFVVSNEDDIKEIIRDYVEPFNIPRMRVILMPAMDKQSEFFDATRFVLEMSKKYGYTGLTRLQLCWGEVTGV